MEAGSLCDICGSDEDVRDGLCGRCREWKERWEAMTHEERSRELRLMAEYGRRRQVTSPTHVPIFRPDSQ